MKRIVLISCVSKKRSVPAKARDLYISPLFKGNLRYAQHFAPDAIYILSAKYGLVPLDTVIEPYDVTLNTMRTADRKAWAARVLDQLSQVADLEHDHFVFLAGEKYRQYLLPHLAFIEIPMKGLSIGRQLKFLKEKVNG